MLKATFCGLCVLYMKLRTRMNIWAEKNPVQHRIRHQKSANLAKSAKSSTRGWCFSWFSLRYRMNVECSQVKELGVKSFPIQKHSFVAITWLMFALLDALWNDEKVIRKLHSRFSLQSLTLIRCLEHYREINLHFQKSSNRSVEFLKM